MEQSHKDWLKRKVKDRLEITGALQRDTFEDVLDEAFEMIDLEVRTFYEAREQDAIHEALVTHEDEVGCQAA